MRVYYNKKSKFASKRAPSLKLAKYSSDSSSDDERGKTKNLQPQFTKEAIQKQKKMRKRLETRQKEADKQDSAMEKYIREQQRYFQRIDKKKLKVERLRPESDISSATKDSNSQDDPFAPQNIAKALRDNHDETYRKLYPELYGKYLDECDDREDRGDTSRSFEEYLKEAKAKDASLLQKMKIRSL